MSLVTAPQLRREMLIYSADPALAAALAAFLTAEGTPQAKAVGLVPLELPPAGEGDVGKLTVFHQTVGGSSRKVLAPIFKEFAEQL